MHWTDHKQYMSTIINTYHKLPSELIKIAGFDLDDTLIVKNQKKEFKLLDEKISNKISELIDDKYLICIFTNQGGMSVSKNFDMDAWKKMIDKLIKEIIPDGKHYIAVYVAKGYDLFRKPNTGMWSLMKQDLKEQFKLENVKLSTKSFYCGDAGGRTKAATYRKKYTPSSKKDFSDTDRKFAINLGIKYYTPEELFLGEEPLAFELSGFNPEKYLKELKEEPINFVPRKKEMIILIGMPGSGKSEFAKKFIIPEGYVHVNQDTCHTKIKCLRITKEALEKNLSVVVDNTNPDVLSRIEYTSLAHSYGYTHIRALIIETDIELAKHLNNVRHIYSHGTIQKVHDIPYHIYLKKFVKPLKEEYYDKIEKIKFSFDEELLKNDRWKSIFMKLSD